MAIHAGTCTSYLAEIRVGIHRPSDVYKLALYDAGANLSSKTTTYSAAHEVPASGSYKPGGGVLSGFTVSDDACLDFHDLVFPTPLTIKAARGALIYNSSRGDRACFVVDFKEDVACSNHEFVVKLPHPISYLADHT